jgi:hypothetical protein
LVTEAGPHSSDLALNSEERIMASAQPRFFNQSVFRELVNGLKLRRSAAVAPYVIYYGLRTPPSGPCSLGWDGVDDTSLIDVYAAALGRAYDYFSSRGWALPRIDPALGHIPVYVCYYFPMPWTFYRGEYTIHGLLSEIIEPTGAGLYAQAEIGASHEAVHTFTHVHRPLKDGRSALWWWFDEATAVYFERVLCPGNPAPLQYARKWVNRPQDPVESLPWDPEETRTGGYSAAWLVQYLVHEHGLDFLRDVWQQSYRDETPVVAINRLLGTKATFEDLVHRYSVAAYVTELVDSHVFQRFGRRRFSYIARADGNQPGPAGPPWDDTVGPLGCRYYKIEVVGKRPVGLRFEVRPNVPGYLEGLSAEVILDRTAGWPDVAVPLNWATSPQGEKCLQAEVTVGDSVSQVILVVVNRQSSISMADDDVINRAYQVLLSVK